MQTARLGPYPAGIGDSFYDQSYSRRGEFRPRPHSIKGSGRPGGVGELSRRLDRSQAGICRTWQRSSGGWSPILYK